MPLGACSLCADSERKSTSSSRTSIFSLPGVCTASVWNSTPLRWQIAATSRTGNRTPVSLFAHITDTMAVSGRMDCLQPLQVQRPVRLPTGRKVTVYPRFWSSSQNFDIGRVLDGGGQHVPFVRLGGQGAVDRRVIALGAATGEDDLTRLRVDQRRHPGPRLIQRSPTCRPNV